MYLKFVTGAAQGVDASRVVFAFARDGALPGSRFWRKINPYTQTPVNAVWLVMVVSGIAGVLGFSLAAFTSLAGCVVDSCDLHPRHSFTIFLSHSAAVIGLYLSYTVPIFLRITSGRDKLVPGPFSLGRWYLPIGIIAVAWVSFIIVLLLFPGFQDPTPETTSALPLVYTS